MMWCPCTVIAAFVAPRKYEARSPLPCLRVRSLNIDTAGEPAPPRLNGQWSQQQQQQQQQHTAFAEWDVGWALQGAWGKPIPRNKDSL
jgi:hypothetical protein